MDLDFQGLGQTLLGRARDLLPSWLPGGRMVGREYTCSNLQGGHGDSLKVNVETGRWSDFAAGSSGGDLISLWAAIQGVGQGDAFKRLAEDFGHRPLNQAIATGTQPAAKPLNLVPPPSGTPDPEFGPCTASWAYRGPDGAILFHVARFDPPGERKIIVPYSWNGKSWVRKSWPAPRPLYGLELLAARPSAPVMVVEGEKTADAARVIVGHLYVVVTWPGGSQNAKHVDWTPIKGRQVIIWPDADDPGMAAADKIAMFHVEQSPNAVVKVIDTAGQPAGWDAADALTAGWNYGLFQEWARPRANVWKPAPPVEVLPPVNQPPTSDKQDPGHVEPVTFASWERLGIALTRQNTPICNLANAIKVLQNWTPLRDLVWLDVFHRKQFTRWDAGAEPGTAGHTREWESVDELRLLEYFQVKLGLRRMALDQIRQAVQVVASSNKRNEPRDYLHAAAAKWDSQPRIDRFFQDYFGVAEGEYELAASRNWWLQLAGRMNEPGCQSDTMPIIMGEQGLGKSKAFRIIGGPWFAVCQTEVTNPKFHEILQGKLLIEIAELDSFSKADITTVKNILTAVHDRLRMPYERTAQDYPRQCVFVGTTNEEEFLKDNTGNRRFWPLVATKIDLEALARDREQLFAEAGVRLFKGETWHEMPQAAMAAAQQMFRVVDEWEELVAAYISENFLDEVILTNIAEAALKISPERVDHRVKFRLGGIFKKLGFRKTVVHMGGHSLKRWTNKPIGLSTVKNDEPAPF